LFAYNQGFPNTLKLSSAGQANIKCLSISIFITFLLP